MLYTEKSYRIAQLLIVDSGILVQNSYLPNYILLLILYLYNYSDGVTNSLTNILSFFIENL